MSTIITPNIASFKEGEVYVIQLPEIKYPLCKEFKTEEAKESCKVHEHAFCQCYEYWKEVTYARAHPFKVAEKDKEKVTELIKELQEDPRFEHPLNWLPQDLTEYRIEVKMVIKEIADYRNCQFCKIDCIAALGKGKCRAPIIKVACLIEDDK